MHSYIPVLSALLLSSISLAVAQTQNPTTEPAQPAAPVVQAPVAAATHGNITVTRLVLATGVANHKPQGAKESFSTHDGNVFAFAELNTHGHDHVTFQWKHQGKTYFEYKANVKDSSRFRTYSKVKGLSGSWNVTLLDEQGTVLKETTFEVSNDGASHSVQPHTNEETSEKPDAKHVGIKGVLTSMEPEKAKAEQQKKD